ncbi:hypothetical protein [Microlunatus speluncae]|uniref:hypothetical protein n=1 Tax=Microlunatus speluncae TaxID=2594267 RepID=UPI0012664556|nr:hypothetical protein [Microlunatus speluncae]
MTGHDPLDDLRHLAAAGERAARPSEPEEVRARGDRRRRVRRVGTAVGTLAVAVLVGAIGLGVVNQTGVLPHVPDPAGTPSATAAPLPGVTEDNLPTETDLEWDKPGDWKIGSTAPGAGSELTSECFQGLPSDLGSDSEAYRSYTMNKNWASATALQFGTDQAAQEAYRTLTAWADECEETLADKGHKQTRSWDWVPVETEYGEAKFRLISYDILNEPEADPNFGQFEQYGLIRSGNRVEILTMANRNTEHHWATDQQEAEDTGQALDPMIRSLPKAAARLAGDPVEPTPSTEPTRELTDDNQVRPGDLPEIDGLAAEEYKANARPASRPSNCFPESLDSLQPTGSLVRSFRYVITDPGTTEDTSDPLYEHPTYYTVALQFADEAKATTAYEEVSRWVENCADTLDAEGFRAPGGGTVSGFNEWFPVRGDVKTARFTEFSYQRPDEQDGSGFWEAVGLVRVGDRLAIAINLKYGQDSNWDSDPDSGIAGPHPLADIIPAAAKRLAK